jgi:hypothetical protein
MAGCVRSAVCRLVLGLTLATALLAPGAAHGDWFRDCWHAFWRDFHRNNAWPEPFVFADRQTVYAAFHMMEVKGWQQQNTLSAHHFESGRAQLTEAGALKVQAILTEAPVRYRAVFVPTASTPEETQARFQAVREVAQRHMPPGMPAMVFVTTGTAPEHPGEGIDRTLRGFQDSRPAPVLAPASGGSATGN